MIVLLGIWWLRAKRAARAAVEPRRVRINAGRPITLCPSCAGYGCSNCMGGWV